MTTATRLRGAAFAVAAGLLGVACASEFNDAAPAATAGAQPVEATTTPSTDAASGDSVAPTIDSDLAVVVPGVLQFSNALVGGGELDAAALAGKPTAFWFWSPN